MSRLRELLVENTPDNSIDPKSLGKVRHEQPLDFQVIRASIDFVGGWIEDYQNNIKTNSNGENVTGELEKIRKSTALYGSFLKDVFTIEDKVTGSTRIPSFAEIKQRISVVRETLAFHEDVVSLEILNECAEATEKFINNKERLLFLDSCIDQSNNNSQEGPQL